MTLIAGSDYIGIGVGVVLFNSSGEVFLAKRGADATNEIGCWEFPGGKVEFGEVLAVAAVREMREEYDLSIEITQVLGAYDHILSEVNQHWVSITYMAKLVAGTATIKEPRKCSAIGWFSISALPDPISKITAMNLADVMRP